MLYYFKHLPDNIIFNYIKDLCDKENIEYTDGGINSIVFSQYGDMEAIII